MKVTFNTEELQGRLAQLGAVVQSKAPTPVYGFVHLFTELTELADKTQVQSVKLRAMDIGATLTITLGQAKAEGAVSVLLPFDLLAELAAGLPTKEAVIDVENETKATLRWGTRKSHAEMLTHPLNNLPSELDKPQFATAELGLPGFQTQIEAVEYVVESNSAKFTANVALVHSLTENDDKGTPTKYLKLVATNGYCMAISRIAQDLPEFRLLIPKPALSIIRKLVGGTTKSLRIATVEAGYWFYTDTEVLTISKTSGAFPPYERILPKSITTSIATTAKELKAAIAMVRPLADKKLPSITFKTATENAEWLSLDAANTSAASAESASGFRTMADEEIAVKATGPANDFSLNVAMLQPFLDKVVESALIINAIVNTGVVDFNVVNGHVRFLQMPTNPANR